MENQDKIFQNIKKAAHKAEEKDFPAMDNVWERVEQKLDKKEDKKTITLWKKIAVAASLLLFVSIGYQFFKNENEIRLPQNSTLPAAPVVQSEPTVAPQKEETATESFSKEHPLLKKEAPTILKHQLSKQSEVAINDYPIKQEETLSDSNIVSKEVAETITPTQHNTSNKSFYNSASTNTMSGYLVAKKTMNETTSKSEINTESLFENALVSTTTTEDKATKEKTIQGVVTEGDLPLPGVSVIVKGTNRGTQTDFDGKFTIKIKPQEILEFSFIGMKTQNIAYTNQKELHVAMLEDQQTLSEVVIVNSGYEKRSVTTQTSSLYRDGDKKSKSTNVAPPTKSSVIQSLQGKVAGLTISNSYGTPENDSRITVRGVNSVTSTNDPLVVVNGIIVPLKALQQLDPNKISEVKILKDQVATSLFGSKAKNGIIIITTKKLTRKERKQMEAMFKELEHLNAVPETLYDLNQEDYESYYETPFESPKTAPLSTFSIDVDNASYTNIRRMINNGQKVPKEAVRIEEMMNFFKYSYPEPQKEHPFSINTEYSDAPWNPNHKLLRIGLQGKNTLSEELPASNLVFLIDVSGSMYDDNKLPLLKESMKVLVNQLRKEDTVAIVVYAGAAGLILPPTSGDQKERIITAMETLTVGGSTAGGEGIELAYKIAQDHFIKKGNNRVILATDGDFNVGASSDNSMQKLIEEKRKSGVFLTCLGFGMGNYKDSKMEKLADKGNGNYAYIDNIQEANRFLGKEFKGSMFAIAKDVKIQIEFNPSLVQAYRLIGYDNRKLRPEDFENDTVDAGELGIGHQVTALYEIIPTDVNSKFFSASKELKYTITTPTNNSNHELATIKFRYKQPHGSKSMEMIKTVENKAISLFNTSTDFKFGTAVAWFGLTLRESEYVPNKNLDAIKALAQQGIHTDPEGYRAEFIRLLENVKQ
jgi:Ca-activated chloride channel family protein